MSIKSVVNIPVNEEPKSQWPRIGQYPDGSVVLFTGHAEGVILVTLPDDMNYKVGDYTKYWSMSDVMFLPSGSSITLEVE